MTEDERKWEAKKNAMLLALHEIMLTSEFKEKYFKIMSKYESQFRALDGEIILQNLLNSLDENEDETSK